MSDDARRLWYKYFTISQFHFGCASIYIIVKCIKMEKTTKKFILRPIYSILDIVFEFCLSFFISFRTIFNHSILLSILFHRNAQFTYFLNQIEWRSLIHKPSQRISNKWWRQNESTTNMNTKKWQKKEKKRNETKRKNY